MTLSFNPASAVHREIVDTKPLFQLRPADFYCAEDAEAIIQLIDGYAQTAAGGGLPLDDDVKERMIPGLQLVSGAFAILAFSDSKPVGVAVCFQGYSTFAARPLVNIHDLAVHEGHRGQGIGSQLLRAVEAHTRVIGGCKVTLEVRVSNPGAESLYRRRGYSDPQNSPTRFLERLL